MQAQRVSSINFGSESLVRDEMSDVKKDKVTHSSITETAEHKDKKSKKTLPIVTATVAIASLGLSAYSLKGKAKASAALEEYKKAASEAMNATVEALSSKVEALTSKVESLAKESQSKASIDDVLKKFDELSKKINDLNSSGVKDEMLGKIESLRASIEDVASRMSSQKGFFTKVVDVNGQNLPLATVLNPVGGVERAAMEKTLQTESLKRLLGLSEGLKEIPKNGMIRIPTSEYKGYASTGGMAIVPKEIAENLAKMVAGRQDISIVVDMPLYRGLVEKSEIKGVYTKRYNKVIPNADGTYTYTQFVEKDDRGHITRPTPTKMAIMKKINSMNLNIITDSEAKKELVDVYMAETKLPINYEKIKSEFPKELTDMISGMKVKEGEKEAVKEWGSLEIVKDKDGKINAFAKVKTVLYDNGEGGKFDLKVPLDSANNIYNDKAVTSGETERFAYFAKFFYEGLLRGEESRVPLKADLILGNDWQTGPISAMARQLTTVRKNYGLSPDVADKVYNVPIITIMHNAGLSGGSWHSQPKLLNILFGEHSAEVVANSYMPNLSIAGKAEGLPAHLFNGMMEGTGVNPQMMAVSYSDFIIPVSENYAKEIATMDAYGGARKKLFEFRAREGSYGNLEDLKVIANQNGIDPALVKDVNPTLFGITNGADKANNALTEAKAKNIAKSLGMPEDAFEPYKEGADKLDWHNKNKMAGINKIREDINAARDLKNPKNIMSIEMPLETDLTGVTEKTPVFVSAGRIVDQKGLDILAESIIDFYKNFKGTEYPVFYVQGIGDAKYKQAILNAKREVAKTNPDAAKRIVFANLFSEPGRFDCAKLIADWSVCPSWFEPCGLAHKEIGLFSGAGAVVNNTGGLAADLKENVNCIISKFNPDKSKLKENGENFAKAIQKAVDIHSDNSKYREVVETMVDSNFDWARDGGAIYQYTSLLERLGILNHSAATAKLNA